MEGVVVSELSRTPQEQKRIEIVERKGRGHPDNICDCIMNEVSVALSKEYLRRFGVILHHNVDKGLLVAGEAETRFGGGFVKKPMRFVFGDRATISHGGEAVDVDRITVETAKDWFRSNLRFLDPDTHVRYQVELKPGAEELTDIFRRGGDFLGANDTSAAVGYAPMTRVERLVLETERFLNSEGFKKRFPETGEDVKVMGLRRNEALQLTVAMPLIDRFIDGEEAYFRRKAEVKEAVQGFLAEKTSMETTTHLNALDEEGRGTGGVYLSVLGTSAEAGDSGQVGRGNRVNGVFPLMRPTSSEAAAGKNPVSHVGKIYSTLSFRVASTICDQVQGLREVYVWLLSRIGSPINKPEVACAEIVLEPGADFATVSKRVEEVFEAELSDEKMKGLIDDLANGRVSVC